MTGAITRTYRLGPLDFNRNGTARNGNLSPPRWKYLRQLDGLPVINISDGYLASSRDAPEVNIIIAICRGGSIDPHTVDNVVGIQRGQTAVHGDAVVFRRLDHHSRKAHETHRDDHHGDQDLEQRETGLTKTPGVSVHLGTLATSDAVNIGSDARAGSGYNNGSGCSLIAALTKNEGSIIVSHAEPVVSDVIREAIGIQGIIAGKCWKNTQERLISIQVAPVSGPYGAATFTIDKNDPAITPITAASGLIITFANGDTTATLNRFAARKINRPLQSLNFPGKLILGHQFRERRYPYRQKDSGDGNRDHQFDQGKPSAPENGHALLLRCAAQFLSIMFTDRLHSTKVPFLAHANPGPTVAI
ncbi:MAG TPA: hypothetical protein P5102_09570 [Candidatus Competibacteraceae bacterium]|nr:hypothetical protein [Candidatus Competibacteraceae bacterium]